MAKRTSSTQKALLQEDARRLENAIHQQGRFDHVHARALRGHLYVYNDDSPAARLAPLGGDHYGLSFRRHTGRWEPMPFAGPLDEMATTLVATLEPFLQPSDFHDSNSGLDH